MQQVRSLVRRSTRIAALAAVAMLVLGLAGLTATPAGASSGGDDLAALESQVVALHNQARAAAGLPPLVVHDLVVVRSREWSRHMASTGTMQHQTAAAGFTPYSQTTCTPADPAWRWCAENVAMGYQDAAAVHAGWMSSPGHRANILRPGTNRIGIGAWRAADGRLWWTARFFEGTAAATPAPPAHPQSPPAPATTPPRTTDSALARFVDAAYELFTGRPATAAESSAWVGRLAGGLDRRAFIEALSVSDAWLGNEIDEIYDLALGRTPDPSGRAYWTRTVRAGTRITELGIFVFGSDELFAGLGRDPIGFVQQVHQRILGRPAGAGEVATAVARLATGTSRSEIAAGVYGSLESRLQRVDALYREVLGRSAEASGRSYWAGQLLHVDDVRLAALLAGSDEYFARST